MRPAKYDQFCASRPALFVHPISPWNMKSAQTCLRKHTNTSVFVTTIPAHRQVYIWQAHKGLCKSRLGLKAPSHIPHTHEILTKSPGGIPILKARKYHVTHLTDISIDSRTVRKLTFDRFFAFKVNLWLFVWRDL